jgi:hypothetical protein
MHKNLVEQQWVKRIGGRKYRTAKYGVIVIPVKKTFVDVYGYASKSIVNFNHPNALE